jgi:hypothetical protein
VPALVLRAGITGDAVTASSSSLTAGATGGLAPNRGITTGTVELAGAIVRTDRIGTTGGGGTSSSSAGGAGGGDLKLIGAPGLLAGGTTGVSASSGGGGGGDAGYDLPGARGIPIGGAGGSSPKEEITGGALTVRGRPKPTWRPPA